MTLQRGEWDNRFLLSLNGSINKSELEDKRAEAGLAQANSVIRCRPASIHIRVMMYKLNIAA